jgi:ankyrin repeat protein
MNSISWIKATACLTGLLLLTTAISATAAPKVTAEGAKKYFGDVNAPTSLDTRFGKKSLLPLQLAAGNKDELGPSMIRALIEAGAEINKIGPDGDAALHTASSRNAAANIRLLIEHGADVNLKNSRDETALLKAMDYRGFDAVVALLDTGADPNIADAKGNAALHAAANMGDIGMAMKILPLLMQHHAKLEMKNNDGDTPLQVGISLPSPEQEPIIRFLLDAGARPDVTDSFGNTALHEIATQQTGGRDKLVPLLALFIKAGAQINARNKTGETPLYKAVFQDCYLGAEPVITRYLLEHGADADIKTRDGSTARALSQFPDLHCGRTIKAMLSSAQDKPAKTAEKANNRRLDAVINAYAGHVDKAGQAYQEAKEQTVHARGFSGLKTRQNVQARQKLFADFRDKAINLIVLLKDAKPLAWKAVQENKVKASREESDLAVQHKFGKHISEEKLQTLQAQFYWADAYFNVFTMLDQHWGAWRADEKQRRLSASDKAVQKKLDEEMQAIGKLEAYLGQ